MRQCISSPFNDLTNTQTEGEGLIALGGVENLAGLGQPACIPDRDLLCWFCQFAGRFAHGHALNDEAIGVLLDALLSRRYYNERLL